MSSSMKSPPVWSDDKSFETWIKELDMWFIVTSVEKKKHAPLIILESLTGRKREIAKEIPLSELNADDGVEKLLDKLRPLFGKNEVDSTFEVFISFQELERKTDQSVHDYILAFETVSQKLKNVGIDLPTSVLACKMLYSARFTPNERQMVLAATSKLEYELMKSSMKRIFCDKPSVSSTKNEVSELKQEPVFKATVISDDEENAFYGENKRKYASKNYQNVKKFRTSNNRFIGRNPKDSAGNISTCRICGSRNHWARNCPDRNDKEKDRHDNDGNSDAFLTFASLSPKILRNSMTKGIVDTACTVTVCGNHWLNDYFSKLTIEQQSYVEKQKTSAKIMFGGGTISRSQVKCKIPIQIGEQCCFLDVDVISGYLPLLLSIKSLKKAHAIIDTVNNSITLANGDTVPLSVSDSGHLLVDLLPKRDKFDSICLMTTHVLDKKAIQKLHLQFGHCHELKLKELLRNSGHLDKELGKLIEQVSMECKTCQFYQKPGSKPIVSLPLGTEFNDVISLDLHQLSSSPPKWYVHIIDLHTRFSQAAITCDKKAESIVKILNNFWIFNFGAPKKIITDNGGEFDNEKFRENAEFFNIRLLGTAANSPFSNGVCERHNMTLTETFKKTKDTMASVDESLVLQAAVFAKNCLHSHLGYSPYQLVYGRQPRLPTTLEDELPALCSKSNFEDHLNALHEARCNFLKAESSDRIKRALVSNVRTFERVYETGEEVFYYQNNRWRGPCTVIGRDSSVIFIRHSGRVLKAHARLLRRRNEHLLAAEVRESSDDSEDVEANENCRNTDNERKYNDESDSDEDVADHNESKNLPYPSTSPEKSKVPKAGQKVKIWDESGKWKTAEITGRAGKASGKLKDWFNIQYDDSNLASVELRPDSNSWEYVDCSDSAFFSVSDETSAKLTEIENWRNFDVFEAIEDQGQDTITTRWVLTTKEDGTKKARLVARGFQDPMIDELLKDSPTCSRDSFRSILAVFSSKNDWKCVAADVKTAFLQSFQLERDVFLQPPTEFRQEGVIWKLKKCVYGLADASRHWHQRVAFEFRKFGLNQSEDDPCVFVANGSPDEGIVATHVDDFWIAGSNSFVDKFVAFINSTFVIGSVKSLPHKYLGINIVASEPNGETTMDFEHYREKVSELSYDDVKDHEDLIHQLRTVVGKLMWPAMQIQPQMCFKLTQISAQLHQANAKTVSYLNKLVRTFKNTPSLTITFTKLNIKNSIIICFTDASFNNNTDGTTHGGHLIFLMDAESKDCCILSWKSGKMRRVARSTLAAECFALIDGINSSQFCSSIIAKTSGYQPPIYCYTDNRSMVETLYSSNSLQDKRLRVDVAYVRNLIQEEKLMGVKWIETKLQLADCLTKPRSPTAAILEKVLRENTLRYVL